MDLWLLVVAVNGQRGIDWRMRSTNRHDMVLHLLIGDQSYYGIS